jgi:hypothetical protein
LFVAIINFLFHQSCLFSSKTACHVVQDQAKKSKIVEFLFEETFIRFFIKPIGLGLSNLIFGSNVFKKIVVL